MRHAASSLARPTISQRASPLPCQSGAVTPARYIALILALLIAAHGADWPAAVQQGAALPHAVGQRGAGRRVKFVGFCVTVGKYQTADRQHRGSLVEHQLRRGCGRLRQGAALGQLPQRQRCGRLPAVQRQRLLGAQGIRVQEAQKASQLLAGGLALLPAGSAPQSTPLPPRSSSTAVPGSR